MPHQDVEQISLFELSAIAQPPADAPAVASSPPISKPNAESSVQQYPDMATLATDCSQCRRCDLGHTRIQAVIGRGALKAPIMIVGEGPGQTEDETGLPFVGRAGQLLDKILASVNLTTEHDVFIANAVKCRPPDNRTPTPEEIEACRPYLLEQIRLIDPQIILLTGATAVRSILGEKRGITQIRGQWREWQGRLCMPIFHPAYLLRSPSREKGKPKWLMWQDIQAVRSKLDELQAVTAPNPE
jgi:uracil-DNA glycosylase